MVGQVTPIPQEVGSAPGEGTGADVQQEVEAGAAGGEGLMAGAAEELKARIASLEQEVLIKDEDIEALKRSLELTRQELEGAKAAYALAVEDFKRLACEHDPLVPPEVVVGDTIEEVKQSLARASGLVARVRQAIQEQAKEVNVPAGAPPRQGADLSAMSPREKIAYAVRNRQGK